MIIPIFDKVGKLLGYVDSDQASLRLPEISGSGFEAVLYTPPGVALEVLVDPDEIVNCESAHFRMHRMVLANDQARTPRIKLNPVLELVDAPARMWDHPAFYRFKGFNG